MRVAFHVLFAAHQKAQHRQVVLEVVDGVFGARRRRPREARIGFF